MSASERTDGPTVGVCGLGLIGGSILLALRDAGLRVRGCDVWPDPRRWCEEQGVPVDASPEAHARAVDLVILATPPHATAAVAAAALAAAPDVVVVDAASVKRPIVDEVRRRAPDHAHRFLPAHPLAGAETTGHRSATTDLVVGAPWAVCPPADDPEGGGDDLAALLAVAPILDVLDARIVVCTADAHDRAVAVTSHAPHLVAGAVAAVAAGGDPGPLAAVLSGGALRDATRVAAAPVELWLEVLHANAAATADALDATADALRHAADALRSGDHDRIAAVWRTGGDAQATIRDARWAPPAWEPLDVAARWPDLLALGEDGVRVRSLRPGPPGRVVGSRSGG
ncbi:MAG: prephenate dehydrogenase/arogenate dehydrogenase family protein [Solirubrobacteraceae bacterium]|nr:prephenate dehydrogenase/arogenate dehydrogenase family protein [Solirubrobacteraceae bacterium]